MCKHRSRAAAAMLAGAAIWAGLILMCPIWTRAQEPAPTLQAKKDAADQKTIQALIMRLGDLALDEREAAAKRLAEIGEPALDLLEKAAAHDKDPEVRFSASRLVQELGRGLVTQMLSFNGHQASKGVWVTRVLVTPDSRRAISVGADALRCFDLATGKAAFTFEERKGAQCWGLGISADGTRVIVGCHDDKAHVFDMATGKKLKTLLGHKAPVWAVALTPDGKQAISGGGDRTIRVWDVATGKELRAFEGVEGEVRCMDLFTNGKMLVTGHYAGESQPGTVRLWDFESGKEIRAMHGHTESITSVAFSADGAKVVSASWDRTARLWDVATGKELRRFEGHVGRAEYAAITPDGKRVISGGNISDRSLRIWDAATGNQLYEAPQVKDGYFGVAALSNNRQCVSAGRDGAVRVWQWRKGEGVRSEETGVRRQETGAARFAPSPPVLGRRGPG